MTEELNEQALEQPSAENTQAPVEDAENTQVPIEDVAKTAIQELVTPPTDLSTELTPQESEALKHEEEDEEEVEALPDYSGYGVTDFLKLLAELDKETDMRKVMPVLKRIKPSFDVLADNAREQALQAYKESSGDAEAEGFQYKGDKNIKEFYKLFSQIQKNRAKQLAQLETEKLNNLKAKEGILDKIRELLANEETKQAIDDLKKLQTEWKSIGAVPPSQTHELWAKYDALTDKFYDNVKINRELADLDRKHNLTEKIKICEKAEKLVEQPVSRAIKELNRLHEEYKQIGPAPKKEQEALWQRFKLASDRVYDMKRETSKVRDEQRKINLDEKNALAALLLPYTEFNTDRITEWNTKSQEIIEIQKKWEAIRDIPFENVKEASKNFWTPFKKFFTNKNNFLSILDEERHANLAKKIAICEETEALIASQEDPREIADTLKHLQAKWREIGAVAPKYRDSIFDRFKLTCDKFFNQRREQFNSQEKTYEDNLIAKKQICDKIKATNPPAGASPDDIKPIIEEFLKEWRLIGFVPKKDKDTIQNRFDSELSAFVQRLTFDESQKDQLQLHADLSLYVCHKRICFV